MFNVYVFESTWKLGFCLLNNQNIWIIAIVFNIDNSNKRLFFQYIRMMSER